MTLVSRFIDSGLWAYSRYPNYFGEILAWTGVWLVAGFPSLWLQHPWIAASPGFTALLLLYVSGEALDIQSCASMDDGVARHCIKAIMSGCRHSPHGTEPSKAVRQRPKVQGEHSCDYVVTCQISNFLSVTQCG